MWGIQSLIHSGGRSSTRLIEFTGLPPKSSVARPSTRRVFDLYLIFSALQSFLSSSATLLQSSSKEAALDTALTSPRRASYNVLSQLHSFLYRETSADNGEVTVLLQSPSTEPVKKTRVRSGGQKEKEVKRATKLPLYNEEAIVHRWGCRGRQNW